MEVNTYHAVPDTSQRDAAIFLHMDATVDISRLKIVKALFPRTAGAYAGPEG